MQAGIVTISSLPSEPEIAARLLEKIRSGDVLPHPDQEERILQCLKNIIEGKPQAEPEPDDHKWSEVGFFSDATPEEIEAAKQKKQVRAQMIDVLNGALQSLELAEQQAKELKVNYSRRYRISKSKVHLLKVLEEIESDNLSIFEKILCGET